MVDDALIWQSKVRNLEKNLYYKDIQVSYLSQITREINENASSERLFHRFADFLSTEMAVDKMLLLFRDDDGWKIRSSIGFEELPDQEFEPVLCSYVSPGFLSKKDKKFFPGLEYIIPIRHKDTAIAYALIGHFGSELRTHDNYEFVATLANIIAVAIENKRLFNRQLEQERFKNEMKLATEVQQMMLPSKWPECTSFEVSSIYRPLWNIGGDYLDCIRIDKNRTAFCIADVSGKGIAAAMLMANFQAVLHQVIKSSVGLEEIVHELNKAVIRIANTEKIVTFFIGEYNSKTKTLHYINAGHVPPVLYMGGEVQFLDQGTTLLGAVEELPSLHPGTLNIHSDAMIVLYTDGITDLKDPGGRSFEDEILFDFVKKNAGCSVRDFNAGLLQTLEHFNDADKFPDDIAVLTCKISA